jgi:hypothetical protein
MHGPAARPRHARAALTVSAACPQVGFGLNIDERLLVTSLRATTDGRPGPAALAGLLSGSRLVRCNGVGVASREQLIAVLGAVRGLRPAPFAPLPAFLCLSWSQPPLRQRRHAPPPTSPLGLPPFAALRRFTLRASVHRRPRTRACLTSRWRRPVRAAPHHACPEERG